MTERVEVEGYILYRDEDQRVWMLTPDNCNVELLPGVTVTVLGDMFLFDEHGRVYFRKFGDEEAGWRGISFKN